MTVRNRRRLAFLGLAAAGSAPYAAIVGFHLYAKTQPSVCKDTRDVILSPDRPASFGTVRTCRWGIWTTSQTLIRADDNLGSEN
jgi:hypothetical protein